MDIARVKPAMKCHVASQKGHTQIETPVSLISYVLFQKIGKIIQTLSRKILGVISSGDCLRNNFCRKFERYDPYGPSYI